VLDDVRIEQRELRSARIEGGLVVTNPPYGVRLAADLGALSRDLRALAHGASARLAVLTADARAFAGSTVLRTHNGGVPVRLVLAPAGEA
jgi:23S rRNA G2445 N2-methylase RlmL